MENNKTSFVKKLIHDWSPPILRRIVLERRSGSYWHGDYASWQEAAQLCTGYDQANILERVKQSSHMVERGEQRFEARSLVLTEGAR